MLARAARQPPPIPETAGPPALPCTILDAQKSASFRLMHEAIFADRRQRAACFRPPAEPAQPYFLWCRPRRSPRRFRSNNCRSQAHIAPGSNRAATCSTRLRSDASSIRTKRPEVVVGAAHADMDTRFVPSGLACVRRRINCCARSEENPRKSLTHNWSETSSRYGLTYLCFPSSVP
jgi:hypothetical protein